VTPEPASRRTRRRTPLNFYDSRVNLLGREPHGDAAPSRAVSVIYWIGQNVRIVTSAGLITGTTSTVRHRPANLARERCLRGYYATSLGQSLSRHSDLEAESPEATENCADPKE